MWQTLFCALLNPFLAAPVDDAPQEEMYNSFFAPKPTTAFNAHETVAVFANTSLKRRPSWQHPRHKSECCIMQWIYVKHCHPTLCCVNLDTSKWCHVSRDKRRCVINTSSPHHICHAVGSDTNKTNMFISTRVALNDTCVQFGDVLCHKLKPTNWKHIDLTTLDVHSHDDLVCHLGLEWWEDHNVGTRHPSCSLVVSGQVSGLSSLSSNCCCIGWWCQLMVRPELSMILVSTLIRSTVSVGANTHVFLCTSSSTAVGPCARQLLLFEARTYVAVPSFLTSLFALSSSS